MVYSYHLNKYLKFLGCKIFLSINFCNFLNHLRIKYTNIKILREQEMVLKTFEKCCEQNHKMTQKASCATG